MAIGSYRQCCRGWRPIRREGIAISAPGYIDPHSGLITMGGAIRRFDNFAMKSWLETRTGLPVSVENDANCVLLAERWQKRRRWPIFWCSLSVLASVGRFSANQLINGARFRAGEFGYMLTDRPGGRDPRRYSMNENCTLRVLRHRYAQHIGAPLDSVTGELIFDRYDAGDPVSVWSPSSSMARPWPL
ncbi:ROK family protein [Klebsiella pneumoniae]|uniref:ROK family protein n=1 Tax=Klebsiella pneumoniae TaxID=573 RepID=UPI0013152A67|nr:ROK family protein [Klebsiella pneumoniae]